MGVPTQPAVLEAERSGSRTTVRALRAPGRFPTVVYDPGAWWGELAAATDEFDVGWIDANFNWWQFICSRDGAASVEGDERKRWWLPSIAGIAEAAQSALAEFQQYATYSTASAYIKAVTPLARYLDALNSRQGLLQFSIDFGVRVTGLDYRSSSSLAAEARSDGALSRLIGCSLSDVPSRLDLLVVSVTRPEELLTAMVAVRLLRAQNPRLHACLADHSHEDFSLAPHIPRLRRAGTHFGFDTVVEQKSDRDSLVAAIARRIRTTDAPRGFLGKPTGLVAAAREPNLNLAPFAAPPHKTFNAQNILWTRASPGRCYWDRCAFCALNAKHADAAYPTSDDYLATIARLPRIVEAGYSAVNFGDEAISPANLERLSRGIVENRLSLRWACCCKFEQSFTAELFEIMRQAGCYEVFWGVETMSEPLLVRMNKHVVGLDAAGRRRMLHATSAVGIGTHVSLLSGFPGETPSELCASVDFVLSTLLSMRHATFNINEFKLRPGSPIAATPSAFGIRLCLQRGDIPDQLEYELDGEPRMPISPASNLIAEQRRRLYRGLGWDRFGRGGGAPMALSLHFFFGHGTVIKQHDAHEFSVPSSPPRRR